VTAGFAGCFDFLHIVDFIGVLLVFLVVGFDCLLVRGGIAVSLAGHFVGDCVDFGRSTDFWVRTYRSSSLESSCGSRGVRSAAGRGADFVDACVSSLWMT
jgi:hypothetical protein